jgi:hypothetical protein
VVKVCGLADASNPTLLVYELPATPYAAAQLRQATMLNVRKNLDPGDGIIRIVIPRDCPARTACIRGPFKLVDWALVASHGMNTNAFTIGTASQGGLKTDEALDFEWMSGADTESVGPQFLSIELSSGGTVSSVQNEKRIAGVGRDGVYWTRPLRLRGAVAS